MNFSTSARSAGVMSLARRRYSLEALDGLVGPAVLLVAAPLVVDPGQVLGVGVQVRQQADALLDLAGGAGRLGLARPGIVRGLARGPGRRRAAAADQRHQQQRRAPEAAGSPFHRFRFDDGGWRRLGHRRCRASGGATATRVGRAATTARAGAPAWRRRRRAGVWRVEAGTPPRAAGPAGPGRRVLRGRGAAGAGARGRQASLTTGAGAGAAGTTSVRPGSTGIAPQAERQHPDHRHHRRRPADHERRPPVERDPQGLAGGSRQRRRGGGGRRSLIGGAARAGAPTIVSTEVVPSARRRSAIVWKRSSGAFSSARRIARSISARHVRHPVAVGRGGGVVTCRTTRSPNEGAWNGGSPHSISYRITPSA